MNASTFNDPVHRHNLPADAETAEACFGLRLTLPEEDTFAKVLGSGWQKERWFTSEAARDNAITELRRQHPYYRLGDRPTLQIQKINRPSGQINDS